MPRPAPPKPQHRDPLLGKRDLRHRDGREQRPYRHGRGALDVVIEGAKLVAVAIKEPRRIDAREVLPLQQNVRPSALHLRDELIDKFIIFRAADALLSPANIERVFQPFFIVRSHVE